MECKFEESLGYIVNITAQSMKNRFSNFLKPYNIAPEQFATMLLLKDNNAITLTEIANILYKDKTTVTRMIDSLEKKELVIRNRVKSDRRAFSVELTDKALEIVETVGDRAEKVKKRQLELFSEDELNILKNCLERLRNFEFEE
jgi:DNA-binding MarR family transcriptional regulator